MKLEIKFLQDCFGGHSFFGYKDGKQYTDGYSAIIDLLDDYPEFLDIVVTSI